MNSLVKVVQPARQSFLVVPPGHIVHAGRRLPFQGMEAFPKMFNGNVWE
jgi:hypothetical protein